MCRHLSWIALGASFLAVSLWVVCLVFFAGSGPAVKGERQKMQGPPPLDASSRALPGTMSPSIEAAEPPGLQGTGEQTPGESGLGYRSRYGDLPESLRGVEIPALKTDGKGNLILDRNLRDVFDFFMTEFGDEPREVVLGRIRELMEHRVGKEAASEGCKVLDGYAAYRDSMAEAMVNNRFDDPEAAGSREAVVSALKDMQKVERDARLRFLGAKAASAFFADQEAHEDYLIRKLEIESNPSLTAEEKAHEIGKLDEQYRNRYRSPF